MWYNRHKYSPSFLLIHLITLFITIIIIANVLYIFCKVMSHKNTDFVIVKFDYEASDSHELGIQKGEKLTLIDDSQHWWKVMNSFGKTGYVPSNYVKRSKQVSTCYYL